MIWMAKCSPFSSHHPKFHQHSRIFDGQQFQDRNRSPHQKPCDLIVLLFQVWCQTNQNEKETDSILEVSLIFIAQNFFSTISENSDSNLHRLKPVTKVTSMYSPFTSIIAAFICLLFLSHMPGGAFNSKRISCTQGNSSL